MTRDIEKFTSTKQILTVLHIIAWVAFIGFMIEAGAILFSYGVSCVNPLAAKNLYRGLDLFPLQQFSFWHYTVSVSFLIALSGMKAHIAWLFIQVLSKVKLENPFTAHVVRILEKMSGVFLGVAIVTILYHTQSRWMLKKSGIVQYEGIKEEFFIMAALVFVLSQVFKRGVEIQSENDLTV